MSAGTMRAVVYLGPEQIELRRVPVPEPGAGELLVKVQAAATCGTDVKTFRRGHPKFPPPFIFGHEFAGDIVAAGVQVQGFRPGMRVTANVFAECEECFYCRQGQGNLCEKLIYNFGAFAEYVIVPSSIVRKNTFQLPAYLSYAEAAVLEPLVSVVHAQRRIAIQPGETVVILGAGGPIGLLHLQLALHAGATQVWAVDHSAVRLEVARQLGATQVINSRQVDPLPILRECTGGRGADVAIECAGTKETWELAVEAVRKGGRVQWFGGLPGGARVELDAGRIHYGEITLYGTHGGTTEDARCAFEMIASGAVQVKPLLSGELPLEGAEQALRQMMSGNVIKMILNPEIVTNPR